MSKVIKKKDYTYLIFETHQKRFQPIITNESISRNYHYWQLPSPSKATRNRLMTLAIIYWPWTVQRDEHFIIVSWLALQYIEARGCNTVTSDNYRRFLGNNLSVSCVMNVQHRSIIWNNLDFVKLFLGISSNKYLYR